MKMYPTCINWKTILKCQVTQSYLKSQNPSDFFYLQIENILKFIWILGRQAPPHPRQNNLEKEGSSIGKVIWKKNKTGGPTVPDFKTYYKATVIRTVVLGIKMDIQISGIEENPEINHHIQGLTVFDKCAKIILWGKDQRFSKWCWENWMSTCRRMKLDPYLTPY